MISYPPFKGVNKKKSSQYYCEISGPAREPLMHQQTPPLGILIYKNPRYQLNKGSLKDTKMSFRLPLQNRRAKRTA